MRLSVPFLSGLSSSKVGGGAGDGVDASTVAVINEICERALQSDVAAAVAAARAVAGAPVTMSQSRRDIRRRMFVISWLQLHLCTDSDFSAR